MHFYGPGFAVKMFQISKIKSSCFIHSTAKKSSFGISVRIDEMMYKDLCLEMYLLQMKPQIIRKIQFEVENTCYLILYGIVTCH